MDENRTPKITKVFNLTETDLSVLARRTIKDLRFKVVKESEWLLAAYKLLISEFNVEVMDPYQRYVEWLEWNRRHCHPFPYLLIAVYLQEGAVAYLAGVISGNIMPVQEYAGPLPSTARRLFIFAIGHQVTSRLLRQAGWKGVGTRVWQFGVKEARRRIRRRGGAFCYSLLEAEKRSLGFYCRLGYRWPQGVPYWQPPLEFDENGRYLHQEVPETLLLRPMDGAAGEAVSRTLLQNIIATAYLNWSLHKYRKILSPNAMRRAEDYVMKVVFTRICERMPKQDPIKLVDFKEGDDDGRPILSRGV